MISSSFLFFQVFGTTPPCKHLSIDALAIFIQQQQFPRSLTNFKLHHYQVVIISNRSRSVSVVRLALRLALKSHFAVFPVHCFLLVVSFQTCLDYALKFLIRPIPKKLVSAIPRLSNAISSFTSVNIFNGEMWQDYEKEKKQNTKRLVLFKIKRQQSSWEAQWTKRLFHNISLWSAELSFYLIQFSEGRRSFGIHHDRMSTLHAWSVLTLVRALNRHRFIWSYCKNSWRRHCSVMLESLKRWYIVTTLTRLGFLGGGG